MALKAIALLLPFILLLLIPSSSAFNITRILEQYPDFTAYNALLSKTGLANQINGRTTITVLVVDNGAIGALDSIPSDLAKRILSVHVILDYYDSQKLNNLKNKVTSVTTLYQTTGDATQFRGFLNITKASDQVQFGSATVGSQLNSDLVKSVAAKPYNISVLQVSSIIVPPGIDQSTSNSPPAPAPPVEEAAAPAIAPTTTDQSPLSPPPPPPPEADAPTVSGPAPADAPNANKKEADLAAAPVSRAGQVSGSASFGVAAVAVMAAAAMLGL